MKSKCYIHGETSPGPAGAGFPPTLVPKCAQGLDWAKPSHVFTVPTYRYQAVPGASPNSRRTKSLETTPCLCPCPWTRTSLGHTSDPSASVLLGAVQLEVTDLGLGAVSAMRAGSCGASSLPEDILASFLAGPCCPSVSTLFLEEQEHLQGLCTESCQVTALLPVPQETVLTISQALSCAPVMHNLQVTLCNFKKTTPNHTQYSDFGCSLASFMNSSHSCRHMLILAVIQVRLKLKHLLLFNFSLPKYYVLSSNSFTVMYHQGFGIIINVTCCFLVSHSSGGALQGGANAWC